jgi:hypothetical protein
MKKKMITEAEMEGKDIVFPQRFGEEDVELYVLLHNRSVTVGESKAWVNRKALKQYFAGLDSQTEYRKQRREQS